MSGSRQPGVIPYGTSVPRRGWASRRAAAREYFTFAAFPPVCSSGVAGLDESDGDRAPTACGTGNAAGLSLRGPSS
jgi:hypothetical protein